MVSFQYRRRLATRNDFVITHNTYQYPGASGLESLAKLHTIKYISTIFLSLVALTEFRPIRDTMLQVSMMIDLMMNEIGEEKGSMKLK